MRELLYLTHRIPYPPDKGDKIRAWHMLCYLRRHFRVHLGCFIDDPADWQHAERLRALCASSCFIGLRPGLARLLSLRGLLQGKALSLPYYRSGALARWVGRTLEQENIATALAFSGPMAQYLPPTTPRGPLRRVLDLVDVDSEKWRAYAATAGWPQAALYRREAALLLAFERASARRFDAVTLVSPAEAALFRLRAPESAGHIDYFNNGVDAGYFSPAPACPSPYQAGASVIVFTGAMDYQPNIDAVRWFAAQVLPALRQAVPALRLYIVGARPATAVQALAHHPGVCITGRVADVRPYLQHAALAVAPLLLARGIQNKVLEAMSMQKIVLASPQALEGLHAVQGQEVLCATDAAQFIATALAVLTTPQHLAIGPAARRRVLADYCWDSNLKRLGALLGLPATAMEPAA